MTKDDSQPKFTTVFEERKAPSNRNIPELIRWCKIFADHGLAPKENGNYAGNLSFRTPLGFIITASGADMGHLDENDFTEVFSTESVTKRVIVRGLKEPSSESILHDAVYQYRKDANAVFHGHDELVLKYYQQLDLPITQLEQPFGTIELMKEVRRILCARNYIVIKNHGFLSLGIDLEEAGREALRYHCKAVNLIQRPFN
ncbi:MAG: class II aldolase/adducin family protein [Candidatus Marinimicrobia bacterium]|nr:class II aldolase/adducin family protein [Candidatus Neomarinimicrobiota bacterium]